MGKQSRFASACAEYLLLLAGVLAWLCNLASFFVTPAQLWRALPGAALAAALALLLLSLHRAFTLAGLSLFGLAAAALGLLQLKTGAPLRFVQDIQAGGGLARQPRLILPALALLGCFLALVLFCTAKNRVTLAFTFAVGAGLVLVAPLLGYEVSIPLLLVFCTACGALFLRRSSLPQPPPRGLTLAAVALCAAAAVASQGAFTYLHAVFGDKPELNVVRMFQKAGQTLLPSKSGFGDEDPAGVLGRPLTLDRTLVLEVQTAGGPFHLKGRIYDNYSGKNWTTIDSGDTANNQNAHAFIGFSDAFVNQNFSTANESLYNQSKTMSITFKVPQRYVFVPEGTFTIESANSAYNASFSFFRYYPDLKLQTSQPSGTDLVIRYFNQAEQLQEEAQREKAEEAGSSALEDPLGEKTDGTDSSSISDYYIWAGGKEVASSGETYSGGPTQAEQAILDSLPANEQGLLRADMEPGSTVTQRTYALAAQITQNCSTAVEKVDAIKAWLGKNCAYTLNPKQPSSGQDFVDYFLFSSRAGYCEHFASAMTVLLRCAGVPARYVSGYYSPVANAKGVYEITNAQAHAWVEFYTESYGFLTADPTPSGFIPAALYPGEGAASSSSSSKPSSSSSSPSSSSSSAPAKSPSAPAAAPKAGKNAAAAGAAGAAASLAALLLVLYSGAAARRALLLRHIEKLPPLARAQRAYAFYAGALRRMGFACELPMTPREYAASLRGKLDFSPVPFEELTRIFESARFGGHAPSEEELRALRTFRASFPGCCRKALGTPRYVLWYPFW